jgi:hypothetical protein
MPTPCNERIVRASEDEKSTEHFRTNQSALRFIGNVHVHIPRLQGGCWHRFSSGFSRTALFAKVAASREHGAATSSLAREHERHSAMKSKSLHIRMVETSEIRIDLKFRASFAEHLPRLLPKAICRKLAQRSIDPANVAARAVASEFEPGELFSFTDRGRFVRAWLE